MSETPMSDELEKGPYPSFVTEIKRAAEKNKMAGGLLKVLERSYEDKKTHWKHGGIVAVKGYGGGVIGRYSDLPEEFPEVAHFHTMRINQPNGKFYTTKALKQICDIWDEQGSSVTNFHGSTGDMVLLGTFSERLQVVRDKLEKMDPPFDIGGSGSDLRTPSACIGPARCEWALYDTLEFCYEMTREFQSELHRPMWPYKFKFKFSGCPNDCIASKARSDFAVIGTWKDEIKIDQNEVKEYAKNMDIQEEVIDWCPTKCMNWDGKELKIDDANCVRCMHCINKMPKALRPGDDRGATILVGGKAPFMMGSTIGWVLFPFLSNEDEDEGIKWPYEYIKETVEELWEFWDEEGKFRERVGELLWRKGMNNLLEVMGLEAKPYHISSPRNNPFMFFKKEELVQSPYLKELEKRGLW